MAVQKRKIQSKAVKLVLKKAVALAKKPGSNFVELSLRCHELKELDSHALPALVSMSEISTRVSYNLAEVGKAISLMTAKTERLQAVGWTKLSVISPVVDSKNWQHWLKQAEGNSVTNLKRLVAGETPHPNPKSINLSLSAEDYEKVATALVKFGATQSGRRIKNKEEALVRMVESLGFR